MDRREFIVGGLCLATAAGAYAATPRERMSLIGSMKLENVIPKTFAGWKVYESGQIVTPQSDQSLAGKLYSQNVGRVYVRDGGEFVMMMLAYGSTQSDTLQLHRPEACYPAFGFNLARNEETRFPITPSLALPGRDLIATTSDRVEYVSYWTRIGHELPTSGSAQRSAKLRSQLSGVIPDGVLARFSTLNDDAARAFEINKRFVRDLLGAVRPEVQRALIGETLATKLAGHTSKVEGSGG